MRVNVHDFEDKDLGKVVPYGVNDVTANAGFVSVGITSDTAQFAVQSIRTWLARMGRERYPDMKELTITADCGGSNGARVRLWKIELQKLADETKLTLSVHHYPPGTSKWNRIEHRLFCHITQNWRGRPLTDRIAVVELIGATTTKAGLKVECASTSEPMKKASRSATPKWTPSTSPAMRSIRMELHNQTPPARGIVAVIVRDVLKRRGCANIACPARSEKYRSGAPGPRATPGRAGRTR